MVPDEHGVYHPQGYTPKTGDDPHQSGDSEPHEEKPKKKPKQPPPAWVLAGKPIRKGPRRMLWYLYLWLKLYKIKAIPQPRPHGVYIVAIWRKRKEIRAVRKLTQAIVTVFTIKGGATKTTRSTWSAAILMWIIKLQVNVFDVDSGGGKSAKRFGLERTETLESKGSITQIADKGWMPTYENMVHDLLGDDSTGVQVFYCKPTKQHPTPEKTALAIRHHKHNCHTLFVDTGPGLGNSMKEGAAVAGTVLEVVGLAHSSDDMDDIEETLNDEGYGLRDRIDQVLVVISGVGWNEFNTRTQYAFAERFEVDPDNVVLIPHHGDLKGTHKVAIPRLGIRSLFAEVHLAEVEARVARLFNELHPDHFNDQIYASVASTVDESQDSEQERTPEPPATVKLDVPRDPQVVGDLTTSS